MGLWGSIMNIGMRAARHVFIPKEEPAPEPVPLFETNFDNLNDFNGFYITPVGAEYETDQALTPDGHRATILRARAADNEIPDAASYKPHRGYPTIQLYKRAIFKSPLLVSLKLKLNISLQNRGPGKTEDWFSPATFTGDISDAWQPTLTVAYGPDGYMRWMHVPDTGLAEYIYQVGLDGDPEGLLKFPQGREVRLDMYLDLTPDHGRVLLYQEGILISMAALTNGNGLLSQAHFGMYASAAVASGEVYNRKLRITPVKNYDAAWALITAPF